MAIKTPVCSTCKSDNITADVYCQWNNFGQYWEITGDPGENYCWCNKCDNETSIEWITADEH